MTSPAIELSGVTKTFGSHTAVRSLDLNVPTGSLYGFIGPNGSGKTTTIRMILHILQPDSGEVRVLGETGSRASNDRIGYLPEERGLYKKMTVARLLAYYGSLKGMGLKAARLEADRWLERMSLSEWRKAKIEALSKGMSQKIQFISTVISKPALLILDEPFSGLDPVNLEVMRSAILELVAEGTTVVLSTHDMTVAEQLCDNVVMIFKGDKVLDGSMSEVNAQYGQDTIRIRADGGARALDGLSGIDHVADMGTFQEVRYRGDSQELLAQLTGRTAVRHFEETRPTLHDIFIRIAGPEAQESIQAEGVQA